MNEDFSMTTESNSCNASALDIKVDAPMRNTRSMLKKLKKIIFAFALTAGGMLAAKEYEKIGNYHHVEVVSVGEDCIQIMHDDGVTMLSEDDLQSPDFVELRTVFEQEKRVQQALTQAQQEEDTKRSLFVLRTVQDCTEAPSYNEIQRKITALQERDAMPPKKKKMDELELSPEDQKKLRTLTARMQFLHGQLTILKGDLERALIREEKSHAICQRKMRNGHKDRCTCCETRTNFSWDLYKETKAACCKAYIAAVLQRQKKEEEIAKLRAEFFSVCNQIKRLWPDAELPQIEEKDEGDQPSEKEK